MTDWNMDVVSLVQELKTENAAIRAGNAAIQAQNAAVQAENAAIRAEMEATKTRLKTARRRASISAGLGFAVLSGTLLISPGSRSALAQGGITLANLFSRVVKIEAVDKAQDTKIADLYTRVTNAEGKPGPQGPAGPQGPKGDKGEKGAIGSTGAQGPQGEKGDRGATGATGTAGAKGEKGATGATGAQGLPGKDGKNGTNGKDGVNGKDGKDADMTRVVTLESAMKKVKSNIDDLFGITNEQGHELDILLTKAQAFDIDFDKLKQDMHQAQVDIQSVKQEADTTQFTVSALQLEADTTKSNVDILMQQVQNVLQSTQNLNKLNDLFHLSPNGDTLLIAAPNLQTVRVDGANFQITNGTGLEETMNGRGNLIVGYNRQSFEGSQRTGSHNLVLGGGNGYVSYGGIVGGEGNTISAPNASVIGGLGNTASGADSVVLGGFSNVASGEGASVVGGKQNTASGARSAVGGGFGLNASGEFSWFAGNP